MNPIDTNEDLVYDIETLKAGSQVILLRHAKSYFNEAHTKAQTPPCTEEDELNLFISKDMRDAQLSEFGIEQCLKASEVAKSLPVHTIFVSPMRRAIKTTYLIFKDHPNFEKINFILTPKLREHLHSSNDIPWNIEDTVKEYSQYFKNFDTSALDEYEDPKHYFIEDLNQPLRDTLAEKIQPWEDDEVGSNACEVICNYIKGVFPERSESIRNTYNRGQNVRDRIRQLLESGKVAKDEKIIVCAHSFFFRIWTNKWSEETEGDHELGMPNDYVWMKNCEFISDNQHFPREE